MSDFKGVHRECDIVMKGGITSGVVYPLTVAEIARTYRFRNIGGASAGALAAAITAAAEHGRDRGGFERVLAIPEEVATKLRGFFQPVKAMKPVFDAILALQDNKRGGWSRGWRAVRALLGGYWPWTLGGLVPGLVLGWSIRAHGGWAEAILVLLVCLIGVLAGLAWRLYRVVVNDLPANRFGLCTGRTMPGAAQEGLTDWLARTIDEVAGRDPEGDPLTFEQLWGPDRAKPRIRLDMMTTNLSMYRAHRLPLRTDIYKFRRSEFEELFPRRVVKYMVEASRPVMVDGRPFEDYYKLPTGAKLPVVVAARMSLSFPGLIQAVPLYVRDFTLKARKDRAELRRCLFSDGGLTSNFPIHFFDRLLPAAPTFAVTLEPWRVAQHGPKRNERAYLPVRAIENIDLPVYEIGSFPAFLMSLIDSAKGWQDTLQSTLPGYRERIVHIPLDYAHEGGFNLAMDEATIRELVEYGRQAGEKVVTDFDFDEHRWRRFLVAGKRLEETLEQMYNCYGEGDPEPFRAFLQRYSRAPKAYKQTAAWLESARSRFDAAMALAEEWRKKPLFADGKIPRPESDLRITPRY